MNIGGEPPTAKLEALVEMRKNLIKSYKVNLIKKLKIKSLTEQATKLLIT